MDLETLKDALRTRTFDGHLFERPVPDVVLDTEARVREIADRQRQRDFQRVAGGAMSIGLWFLLFDHRQPWWVTAGITFMIAGSVLELVCYLRLCSQGRRLPFDLTRREFLVEERRAFVARARILRRDIALSAVPMVGGLLLYVLWLAESAADAALGIGLVALAAALTFGPGLRKVRRETDGVIEELDRELAAT
jgi:hypothetical protein